MQNDNTPLLPGHYVETDVPDTRKPPVTEVGPLGWLYKNLFSTWYNTILTIGSVLFIAWALDGLAKWVIGSADWGVITINLPLFGTGRYPSGERARVDVYILIIAFLAGVSWRLWGRMGRGLLAAILVAVVVLFALPPIGDTMDCPPSYQLISPLRAEPLPAMSFIAEKDQTITFTLTPTTDFTELPTGFMDNASLTTGGQIQMQVEREELSIGQDLQATLTVMDRDLNVLDTLTVSMADEAVSQTVTFPKDGWYVLQVASEGEDGAIWLSMDGFEPLVSRSDIAEERIATYGDSPALEDTRNRVLDLTYLITFSGTRSFAHFMSIYLGPLARALQWGVLELVAALLLGYGLAMLARSLASGETNIPIQADRIRAAVARVFSGSTVIILWLAMFPLLIILVRGLTPGEIVRLAQGGAIAVGAFTFFVFTGAIIPESEREWIERYVVIPALAGAWVAAALLTAFLLGTIVVYTAGKIRFDNLRETWDLARLNIMPGWPVLILDVVGFVTPLLVVTLVATVGYIVGRGQRESDTGTGRAGIALATSVLIIGLVQFFLVRTHAGGLGTLTIGEMLVFIVFGAAVVGLASTGYGAALFAWASYREAQPPRRLLQVAGVVIALAVVAGGVSALLTEQFRVPEGGLITFLEFDAENLRAPYAASAAVAPESCKADDTIALLFGAQSKNDYYAFRLQCGGAYTLVQRTGSSYGAPLIEGQLSRPVSTGSPRPQVLSVAVTGDAVAAWWGSSLLGTAEASIGGGSFGFALEPASGTENLDVTFDAFTAWQLDEAAALEEVDLDDLGEPALQMGFVTQATDYQVKQSVWTGSVRTFGESLVMKAPKLFQRDEIIKLVDNERWGGLLLTMVLTVLGNAASFPIGVALALGRRSKLPVVRFFSTVFIEFVRGVPLVTVLFMANLLVPLLEPSLRTVPNVIRALIGMTLFNAAYVAETVRGGLQAISRGQYEAAYALGMNAFWVNVFIILPQALRAVIPAMVGQFISLFKDTSLAFIIGLIELLGVSRTVITQAEYIGLQRETFVFAAVIYFVISYAMSYGSRRLEETGVGATRRM